MSDNLNKSGKGDDIRTNINQDHEVTYWTKKLNTSPDKLKKAVATVGPMVEEVKRWLNSNS